MREVFRLNALFLCPFASVCQRAEFTVAVKNKQHIHACNLDPTRLSKVSREQIEHRAGTQDGKV